MKNRSSFEFMYCVSTFMSNSLFKALKANLKVVFEIQHFNTKFWFPTRYSDNQKKCVQAASLPPTSWGN